MEPQQTTGAFRFDRFGDPEVLTWQQQPLPPPGPGEILIRQQAIGVNYIDIYHRTGQYGAPLPLPSGLGVEGAGIIAAIGTDVTEFVPGDRIAYAGGPPGAYAEARLLPAARAVKIPDGIASELAAALLFKGLTAEYLVRRCYPVASGQTALVHAAAGGVGQLLCQWLRHLGATVIGTVSSDAKAELAKAAGSDQVLVNPGETLAEQVRAAAGGGVDVVYDGIGKDSFFTSLDCLKPRGTLVSFGAASGPVPPFDIALLGAKGSLFVTRPSLVHYTASRAELMAGAAAVFDLIRAGVLKADITCHPLREAPQVHLALEGRQTAGSVVLVP